MRKSIVSKALCAALSLSMCIGMMSGCGGAGKKQKEDTAASSVTKTSGKSGKVTYPAKDKVTLTMAMIQESQVTTNAKNLAVTPFGKEWQKATGVTLKMQQVADDDAMNLIFASGDLPDIISYSFGGYPGGATKAIKDKLIYPIDDLMGSCAPDLKKVLESNKDYEKSVKSSDGKIIGFPFIRGDKLLRGGNGIMLRSDWLKELNLKEPQTPDELYNVLKAFKEKKGASVPFSSTLHYLFDTGIKQGILTSAFGLPMADYYQKDGKVHYGVQEEGYKDLLTWLHKLYKDGLLDPNFSSVDVNTQNGNIMNGDSGVTLGPVGGTLGNYIQTMKSSGTDFDMEGIAPLVAKDGDTPMCTYLENPFEGSVCVITPACKNKEAAAKFLNYGYTEAGHNLFNFGVENESYTVKNNVPTYTDTIMNNKDGLTMQLALAQYTRAWAGGPFVQDVNYIKQYAGLPQQQDALEKWNTSDVEKYKMPYITISEKDLDDYTKYKNDIETYVSEMFVKFVSGETSLSKFDSEYLKTLDSMGIDKVLKAKQDALDEYNSR